MKFRIKHAQKVVGFFLLASVVALAGVLVFMGANQRWFARNYVFFSRFSSAEGITTGMSVQLKGFEIGKVSKVELNNFNRVRVEISVFEDYYQKIRPDSVLELSVSPIGLGGGTMNLLPGLNQLPPMEENSFLPSSECTLGLALIAQGVVDKPVDNGAIPGIVSQIEPLLVDVRTTATAVSRFLDNINGAIEGRSSNQVGALMSDLRKTVDNLNQIATTSSTNANALMTSAQTSVANINGITDNLNRLSAQLQDPKGLIPKLLDPQGSLKTLLDDKNALYDQLNQILTQVHSTLEDVQGVTSYLNKATPQISGLVEDAKDTVKKTGDVMEGLSNNPLLKGGITPPPPPTSTLQGQRDENF